MFDDGLTAEEIEAYKARRKPIPGFLRLSFGAGIMDPAYSSVAALVLLFYEWIYRTAYEPAAVHSWGPTSYALCLLAVSALLGCRRWRIGAAAARATPPDAPGLR